MKDADIEKKMNIEFATKFHGECTPGLVLGLKMIEILYKKFEEIPKGKKILGIAETKFCIPDALQIGAKTTVGNKNLIVYNFGKLALSLVLKENGHGYRISLKKEAIELSPRIRKFVLREGKLSQEEKNELLREFYELDEKYFKIEKISIDPPLREEQLSIEECSSCGELQPLNLMSEVNGRLLCQICCGNGYFYRK